MKFLKIALVLTIVPLILAGCDFSAKWDLRRAEKALNEADEWKASFWAEPEYLKAQKAFDEAVDLAAASKINDARDKAQIAREWAQDAISLSQTRQAAMEKERDALGSYKE